MPGNVRSVEFYHDSEASDPKEDPDRIQGRLSSVAEREGIEVEVIDTADYSDEERKEFYHDATGRIRDDREYHVGNRVFTRGMFASTRPVLLIEYEDVDGIDLYPHRREGHPGVVGILDFLDEVEGVDENGNEDEDEDEREAPETETETESETETGRPTAETSDDAGLLSRLSALLPG